MSANQKRRTYCVWDNVDDSVIAIDLNADQCAMLMDIDRSTFYSFISRMKSHPECKRRWTIIDSNEIG